MVLDGNETSVCVLHGLGYQLAVNGFDGEGVDETQIDAFLLEHLGSLEGLEEGHTSRNDRHVILAVWQRSQAEL